MDTQRTQTDRMPLPYPRRRFQRVALRAAGRVLLPVLARPQVSGQEHYPAGGPLLVVGNHTAAIEVALMIAYTPWQLEMIGPGDLPPLGVLSSISQAYGYTPINRGNVDRQALTKVLGVLKQGGVVGLFPEGGIWDTGPKPAKRGVAWLSHQARAPILPIGLGGLEGALEAISRLRRPRLWMSVGEPIPPVTVPPGASRKVCYQQAADRVMQAVYDLIPAQFKEAVAPQVEERFELQVEIHNAEGERLPAPAVRALAHGSSVAKMLFLPAIMVIYSKDLGLEIGALRRLIERPTALEIAQALAPILTYVGQTNPGFLTYRFGMHEGQEMEEGLRELHDLALWAAENGYDLTVSPIRHYRLPGEDRERVQRDPGTAHAW